MDFHDPNLVLYADLAKHDGAAFMSDDAYGHLCTVTGATWQPDGRDFNSATPDYIELDDGVATSPLNFTSEDFSIIIRIKADLKDATRVLVCRGLSNDDGWFLDFQASNRLEFVTCQDTTQQASTSTPNSLTTDTWYTLGVSRDGASAKLYINGVVDTATAGTHINPATCDRSAKIGVYDSLTGFPFDGKMQFVMAYNRALSELEHLNIHNFLRVRQKY